MVRELVEESRLLALIEGLDAEYDEQIEDDPDADIDLDIPAGYEEFGDPSVRAGAREQLRHTVALARGEQLADQGFDARDRPGEPPDWLDRARMEGAAEVLELELELDDAAPGCFVLPRPPERSAAGGEPGWAQMIARVFAQRANDRPWRGARFGGPLALDIAFRGSAGRRSDLDNAARRVLREFERAFAANAPRVDGYRVYRRPAMTGDVRVRVMPAVRLELLSQAMDDARALAHG